MSVFLVIIYFGSIVLQPTAWIGLFKNIPINEIAIMLGLMHQFFTNFNRLSVVLFSLPSKLFLLFIFISIISVVGEGKSYAFGVIGYSYFRFFLGYLLVISVCESYEKIEKVFRWIMYFGAIVSIYCIRLYFTGEGVGQGAGLETQELNWRGAVQWVGTFSGSNTTGLLLVFVFSIALGLFGLETKKLKKVFILVPILLIGTAFYLTHSRGGFIAIMCVILFYVYLKSNLQIKTFIPISILLLALVFTLKPSEEGRGIGESSTPERIELFYQGLEMLKRNPVIGVGSRQFARNNPVHKTAHNIYLNTLAETGLFGFFFFILLYYVPFSKLKKYSSTLPSSSRERAYINIVFMSTISVSVACFFLSTTHELPYLILAFLTMIVHNNNIEFNISSAELRKVSYIMFILILFVYISIQLFFYLYR